MFGRRIRLFEVFSFKVSIDLSWLVLAVLIVWGLAVGYFPHLAPGLPAAAYWSMGLAGFLGLAASIVAHELAHALVARRYDMPIRGITLFLFGGVAEMDDEPSSPRGEALMAIAGPAMSLALALLCWGAAWLALHPGLLPPEAALAAPILSYLALINGLLVAFNLVPAFPLDGGRVLRAVLWSWRGDILWATRVAGRAGGALALALMAAGLWQIVAGHLLGGAWWILIGLFVRAAARASVAQQLQRAAFRGARVGQFMESEPLAVPPQITVERLAADYFEPYGLASLPVVEDGRLVGRVRHARLRELPAETWPRRSVREVMEPCPEEATITADATAGLAHARMRRTGRRHLLVVEDGALVGLVRLTRLLNVLALRRRLGGGSG